MKKSANTNAIVGTAHLELVVTGRPDHAGTTPMDLRLDAKLFAYGVGPTQPEFAFWDPTQHWGTENRGVIPDIEVTDLPQDVARGVDAQLDRGLTEVQRLMVQHPAAKRDFDHRS